MQTFQKYVVTGTTVQGKRFRLVYPTVFWAMGINLWKGSVWGIKENGERKLLKRV